MPDSSSDKRTEDSPDRPTFKYKFYKKLKYSRTGKKRILLSIKMR